MLACAAWRRVVPIVIAPSSSCPMEGARVGGCGVSFVAYCHPPVVMLCCRCLLHHAVVVSLSILLLFPSLPFPHSHCPHRSLFPPHKQLLMAVIGGVMWWWLSSVVAAVILALSVCVRSFYVHMVYRRGVVCHCKLLETVKCWVRK